MIELETGLPGAGKTLRAIERGLELVKQGKRVYYLDINGLDEEATGFERFPGELSQWMDILKPGDVLIADEVQRMLPAVSHRGAPPKWIEEMTRNRHYGVDMIFITQHPKLIDSFVRRLINKHEHMLNVFGREEANIYTWIQVCEDPESKSERKKADHRRWKYPKEVYTAYKSAELHTRKPHTPRMVKVLRWAVGACVVFALAAVVVMWRFAHREVSHADQAKVPAAVAASAHSGAGPVGTSGGGSDKPELSRADWLHMQMPRFAGMPWSAPAFDDRKPMADPEIYCMAVSAEKRCICHSEQGTRIQVPLKECSIIALVGVYNPFRRPPRAQMSTFVDAVVSPTGDRQGPLGGQGSSPSALPTLPSGLSVAGASRYESLPAPKPRF